MKYVSAVETPVPYDPERELLYRLIERAVLDSCLKDQGARREAQAWLRSRSAAPWSCRWALSYLTEDPIRAQRALRRRANAIRIQRCTLPYRVGLTSGWAPDSVLEH